MTLAKRRVLVAAGVLAFLAGLNSPVTATPPSFVLEFGGGRLIRPGSLDVGSDGQVYVLDTALRCVQSFTAKGEFIAQWPVASTALGLTVGNAGDVYVAGITTVTQFKKDGTLVRQWGTSGSGDGQFSRFYDIASDGSGALYVPDTDLRRVQKFAADGTYLAQWSLGNFGPGFWVFRVAVDGLNRILVYGSRVYDPGTPSTLCRYGPTGELLDTWSNCRPFIDGIDATADGQVYLAAVAVPYVARYSAAGDLLDSWGSSGAGPGQFYGACDVAVTAAGDVYVADLGGRVELFRDVATAALSTTWGAFKAHYR